MARNSYPRGLIQRLAEAGQSATQSLREFREAGGKMANQSWYRMWGEVQNERALGGIEEGAPLHLRPTAEDIIPVTTVRASGFTQRVNIFARNVHGEVFTKTIDVRGDSLISRQNAIRRAEQTVEGFEKSPDNASGSDVVEVLGGVYSNTFELTPE